MSHEQSAVPSAIVEGIGSEVLICVGILLAGLILVAAWLSTYVPQDMRPIAVFVFENFGRGARTQAPSNQSLDTTEEPEDSTAEQAATSEEASAEMEEQHTSMQDEQQQAADSRANLATYDVDVLESDGDLDPEMRERVEDVLQEYTQVMEAKNDTELRNRRLKYFNCLINHESADSPTSSAAAASTSGAAASATGSAAPDTPDAPTPADDQAAEPDAQQRQPTPEPVAIASPDVELPDTVGDRPPGSLLLRLKYFNDDLRTVFASPTESIANFKRRNFQPELSRNMNIRLIYNGRELKEGTDRTLASYSIPEEATIHCLVTERTEDPASAEDAAGQTDGQGDIGNYMFPLFGGILGLIWYCRICYKAYFNFMSTMALGAVTLLFFAAFFASWSSRTPRQSGPIHVHRINLDGGETRSQQRAA